MAWIKICGITTRADAEAITDMGADCLGFIFSTDSPRKIDMNQAGEIIEGVGKISKAGVFVNEDIKKIIMHIEILGLDYVQLSGNEDISYIKELKKKIGMVNIIKVLRLKDGQEEDYKAAERLLKYADVLLLDSYDKYKYGGTGKTIDWESIKGLIYPERLIISGGLHGGNVSLALKILDPYGVDASSRLEVYPGKKDLKKVWEFIKAVRGFKRTGKRK